MPNLTPEPFDPETGEILPTVDETTLSDTDLAIASPPVTNPNEVLSVILKMASDPALDISKLQALLDMQQKMEIRAAEIEFSRGLARLSAKMPQVPKNGRVSLGIDKDSGKDKGSYPFTRWEDMDKVIRPLMAEEGFVLSFDSVPDERGVMITVTGTLLHRDGHHRCASMLLQLDSGPGRNNLQAMGSTLSYGKRYTAEMLLNIVREGDDKDGRSSVASPKGFGR